GVGEGAAAPGSGSGDSVVALKPGAGKGVVALEVNVSCPNLEERSRIFAHDPDMTAAVVGVCAAEVRGRGLPVWAKLSPNVTDLVPIVDAAMGAGASAVTLGNTLMGLVIDTEARRPLLGGGGGGLSGPAVRAVAVRNVFEVHARRPEVPIIGVGGIASGRDAVEYLMAGARAVQVGTATFADPRASTIVSDELTTWCETHGVGRVSEIIGAAHEH
ncbi:MAG TPA: dihydroorotate dehydrogenase, partial [Acidimicrobiales bacterium]|nr:dihydroorotate dehydrogenase [Acidimicrobiales bacterium]